MTLIIVFFGSFASADEWFCTEESSQRRGNAIVACGVGESPTESVARARSLAAAQAEFDAICNISYDCHGHQILVEPKRMTCKDGKCYRLVQFTIQDKKEKNLKPVSRTASNDWHNNGVFEGLNSIWDEPVKEGL